MTDDEKKFTQADVDRIVSERLGRDRESRGDPTALLRTVQALQDENSILKAKNGELSGVVNKSTTDQIKAKIGVDLKVPQNLLGFIQGETEADMRASAEKLVAELGPGQQIGGATNPPVGNTAPKVYTKQDLDTMKPEQINADWANISAQLKAGQVK